MQDLKWPVDCVIHNAVICAANSDKETVLNASANVMLKLHKVSVV